MALIPQYSETQSHVMNMNLKFPFDQNYQNSSDEPIRVFHRVHLQATAADIENKSFPDKTSCSSCNKGLFDKLNCCPEKIKIKIKCSAPPKSTSAETFQYS